MILERHRELTINLGNNTFESVKISARASVDTATLDDGIDAFAWLDDQLTIALASEIKYWHEITLKKDSFIHLVQADNEAKEQETKNA
jgi:hypothetical protein